MSLPPEIDTTGLDAKEDLNIHQRAMIRIIANAEDPVMSSTEIAEHEDIDIKQRTVQKYLNDVQDKHGLLNSAKKGGTRVWWVGEEGVRTGVIDDLEQDNEELQRRVGELESVGKTELVAFGGILQFFGLFLFLSLAVFIDRGSLPYEDLLNLLALGSVLVGMLVIALGLVAPLVERAVPTVYDAIAGRVRSATERLKSTIVRTEESV